MGVSLDCCNGLNWNILEQHMMDILCEFYGSGPAVKHNSVGENSLRVELSAKKITMKFCGKKVFNWPLLCCI